MKTYTITSDQVSQIHNAYCHFKYALDMCNELFKEDSRVIRELNWALEYLEPVRADVMGRKDADWDKIIKMICETCKENDFVSIWSIYNIESFDETSNVPIGSKLFSVYSGKEHTVTVEGPTWADLWKASENLIKERLDDHGDHLFIEAFVKDKNDDNLFSISLGS